MGNCSDKYEVLSSVIQSLESKDTFQNIVKVILRKANTYIQAEYIAVVQKESDDNRLAYIASEGEADGFIEKVSDGGYSLEELNKSVHAHIGVPVGDYVVPIVINGIKAMYLVIHGTVKELTEELDSFIHSIASVIQNIAQMRVTNNSLLSSYEVLKDILNNIGSGIIVCDRSSANILFENKVAGESKEIQNAIRECLQELMASEEYRSYLARKKAYDEDEEAD